MKRKLYVIALAVLLLLSGCGGGGGAAMEAHPNLGSPASSAPAATDQDWTGEVGWDEGDYTPDPDVPSGEDSSGGSIYQNPGVKIIRQGELNIQTEQFDQSVEALNQLTASCGGYFESASVYGGGSRDANARRRGEYVIRVPAERYDHFLTSTGQLGYVTSKSESSQDVGERYYDTEARLKTQRTKQERLLALLERAETMEDIIVLENALSEVEYQIEQYSSELNRYDALVGFSTFYVYLNEVGRVTEEVGETASLGQRMAAGFQASLRGLGQGFQDLLIWMSYNLVLVVILAVVIAASAVAGRRYWKDLQKKKDQE
ncbi:hypothetical protein N510_003160 [Firmicutes bacterium ASF500]|nr:hypothetical protein N510_003160 [Firmicutes bacterium ASF500]